jgi:hypothetical protein
MVPPRVGETPDPAPKMMAFSQVEIPCFFTAMNIRRASLFQSLLYLFEHSQKREN